MPGAVRSWGDAHARFGRLSRRTLLAPAIELAADGFPASTRFVEVVERTRAADRVDDRERRRVPARLPAVRPALAAGRARPQLPALAATLEAIATGGFEAFYDGDLGARRARGLAAAGCPITVDDLRDHASTWGEPIAVDYRGVRVTTHPPNSSGIVALEILAILAQLEPPGPAGVRPGRGDRRRLDPRRDRGGQAGDGRSRRAPDRPGQPRHPGRAPARSGLRGRAGRADRPAPRRRPGPCHEPVGWRHGLSRGRRRRRQRGQPHPVAVRDVRVGRRSTRTRGSSTRTAGSYFSLDPSTRTPSRRASGPLHTLLPGMLFRDGVAAPWVVAGAAGGDAQPQVHAQLVSALVDGGLDLPTAVVGAALVRRAGRALRPAGRGPPRTAPRGRDPRGARSASATR